jgi:hypothetical protein
VHYDDFMLYKGEKVKWTKNMLKCLSIYQREYLKE